MPVDPVPRTGAAQLSHVWVLRGDEGECEHRRCVVVALPILGQLCLGAELRGGAGESEDSWLSCLENDVRFPCHRNPNGISKPDFAPRFRTFDLVASFAICHSRLFGLEAGIRQVLKVVGGVEILPKHKASCHCGAVELLRDLPDGIVNPRRCDCSICRRKGAIVASVRLAGIRVINGANVLRTYQFNTNIAKHYLCSTGGIDKHHQRRSNPEEYGFDVGCLESVNSFDIPDVPTNDGVNHPADRREA